MSLIIKGMDMPNECSECLFSCCDISVGAPARCIILGEHSARYSRLKNCPLVEIPTPHGRLIDADELLKTFEKACDQDGYWVDFFALVESAPTIIEAEVSE